MPGVVGVEGEHWAEERGWPRRSSPQVLQRGRLGVSGRVAGSFCGAALTGVPGLEERSLRVMIVVQRQEASSERSHDRTASNSAREQMQSARGWLFVLVKGCVCRVLSIPDWEILDKVVVLRFNETGGEDER